MKRLLIIFFTLALLSLTLKGFPQYINIENSSGELGSQFNIYKYDFESGLPLLRINQIYQDKNGYIWMTAYDGIIRYDGLEFHLFDTYKNSVLTGNSFIAIQEKNDTIWFSSSQDGLVSYSNNKFSSYGKNRGINTLNEVLYIDNKGRIWSGAPGKGCFYFKDNVFHFPINDNGFLNTKFMSITEGNDGTMYFGSFGNGLYSYKNEKLKQFDKSSGLNSKIIISLYSTKDYIFIGTDKGVFIYDGKIFHHLKETKSLTIQNFLEDNEKNIYFTSVLGLSVIDLQSKFSDEKFSSKLIFNEKIQAGIFDSNGNIWLTQVDAGIYCIKKNSFINITDKEGLSGKVVNTVCEISDGSILIGLDNGKVNSIKNNIISEFDKPLKTENYRIRHIMEDSKGNIWVSTYNGLLKINPKKEKKWFTPATGFPASKIRITYEDSNNNIWAGTRDKGIVRISDGKINKLSGFDFEQTTIMSIEEDSQKNILIGTAGKGLFILSQNDKLIGKYDIESGFISNIIFNTYTDSDGTIWITVNGGMSRLKDGDIFSYTIKNGFVTNSPYDIVEDAYGTFWIPYSRGIISVSKDDLNEFAENKTKDINYRIFDNEEGIGVEGLNSTTQSICTKNGKLLFPAKYGLIIIDPEKIQFKNKTPNVFIEKFSIDDYNLNLSDSIVVKEGKVRYNFEYTAVSYIAPEKLTFRYRLLGFDDDWVYSDSHTRKISYTNLPSGSYTFQVSARNIGGTWNEKGAKLNFTINPLWFHTVWFKVLIILFGFLLFLTIYKIRVNQLKRSEKLLEKKVEERTKELINALELVQNQKDEIETQKDELQSVNEMKDKLFSIIAHDLKAPFGSVLMVTQNLRDNIYNYDIDKIAEYINLIYNSLETGFNLLDNLLEWARFQLGKTSYFPELFDIKPIIDENISLLKQSADNKQINLTTNVNIPINIFADENMFNTILRNLISNAIKFTENQGSVKIEAIQKNGNIDIIVEDTGIGIKKGDLDKILDSNINFTTYGTNNEKGTGLGITIIKEFINLNSGKLFIKSEEGKGSKFILSFHSDDDTE